MATLASWSMMWPEYPDYIYYPSSAQVKKDIGGAVDAAWITNTCAVRLSRGLNYSGAKVPSGFAGMSTVKGGDGLRYAFRVREMRKWLEFAFGKPVIDIRKKRGDPFDKTTWSSVRGIIGFDIAFADATGHLDMWDGKVFSNESHTSGDYWVNATRISLWKMS